MGNLKGRAFIDQKPIGEVTIISFNQSEEPFPSGGELSADSEVMTMMTYTREVQIRFKEPAIEITVSVYLNGHFDCIDGCSQAAR